MLVLIQHTCHYCIGYICYLHRHCDFVFFYNILISNLISVIKMKSTNSTLKNQTFISFPHHLFEVDIQVRYPFIIVEGSPGGLCTTAYTYYIYLSFEKNTIIK